MGSSTELSRRQSTNHSNNGPMLPDMGEDLGKPVRAWEIAKGHALKRLQHVHAWDETTQEQGIQKGLLMLETACAFVHACIKPCQFRLPPEFWKALHAESGIVVYPSAMTANFIPNGLGPGMTFTEVYRGHIEMLPLRGNAPCSQRNPVEYILEVPPKYER